MIYDVKVCCNSCKRSRTYRVDSERDMSAAFECCQGRSEIRRNTVHTAPNHSFDAHAKDHARLFDNKTRTPIRTPTPPPPPRAFDDSLRGALRHAVREGWAAAGLDRERLVKFVEPPDGASLSDLPVRIACHGAVPAAQQGALAEEILTALPPTFGNVCLDVQIEEVPRPYRPPVVDYATAKLRARRGWR